MRAARGLAATLARANARDGSQISMPTADHLQRRRLLCRVERHGADARADIEKAAGERRRQPWTVSGERDNTACVLARGLAEGLKCGGVLKNLPGHRSGLWNRSVAAPIWKVTYARASEICC